MGTKIKNIKLKKIKKIIKLGYSLLILFNKYSNISKSFLILIFSKIDCVITKPDNIKKISTPM